MFVKSVLVLASAACAVSLSIPSARAETLATDAATTRTTYRGDLPRRGLSVAQVEKRYGAPLSKMPTAGGDAPRHPPINRWRYDGYTVYFERNRVIHSVVGS